MKIARRASKAEVPSMAMGDIAFNLIIFFVILARAQDDSHLSWEPARAEELESSGGARVSVVIDREQRYYVNGVNVGQEQLSDAVSDVLGEAPVGKRTVMLKVHREAQALYFEPAMEAIGEAGGELMHILEEETR